MAGPIQGNPQGLNAAPPNPVTSPAAAGESSPIRTLTGGMPPPQPGQPAPPGGAPSGIPQGPDNSGLLILGQKLSEGILTLAQAMPEVAGQLDQARAMLENALANWSQQTMSNQDQQMGAPGAGVANPPPQATTQSGPQFPGGGFGQGRAF